MYGSFAQLTIVPFWWDVLDASPLRRAGCHHGGRFWIPHLVYLSSGYASLCCSGLILIPRPVTVVPLRGTFLISHPPGGYGLGRFWTILPSPLRTIKFLWWKMPWTPRPYMSVMTVAPFGGIVWIPHPSFGHHLSLFGERVWITRPTNL